MIPRHLTGCHLLWIDFGVALFLETVSFHKPQPCSPSGATSCHLRDVQHPAPHTRQRDNAGPPRPHARAHSMWTADPNCPPPGRAAGGGRAPNLRRLSQRRKAPFQGTPSRHPHRRAKPARKSARCGTGAGSPSPHHPRPGNTERRAWLPAPRMGGRERESA